MASLTEHVMINKLGDDLDEAITFVGGDTSKVDNIMKYPQIIKEQLSAGGIKLDKSIILEGDSCVIIADEGGRDVYNTEYAVGEKTGLNPGAYYIRICTAVEDIEPVYIDLTPIFENFNDDSGLTESEVLLLIEKSLLGYVKDEDLDDLNIRVKYLEDKPECISKEEYESDKTILETRISDLEQEADQDLDYIVQQVIESDTIQNTFVSDAELEDMMFTEDELDEILTI